MYQLTSTPAVLRLADHATIPPDPANADWQDYQAWLAAGHTPAPAAQAVPAEVTMRQARLALLAAGKLAAVQAAINSLPSPQKDAAQIEWEYSNAVVRYNGFVEQLAPALGMSPEQIDALFVAAAAL